MVSGNTLKRIFTGILVFLAILMVLFIGLDMYYIIRLQGPVPYPGFIQNQTNERFLISVVLSTACLILVCVMIVLIVRMSRQEKRHESLLHIYQSVFSSIKIGLIVLDEKKMVRIVNDACCILLERDPSTVPEYPSWKWFIDPVLEPVAERLNEAIENNETFSREYRVFLPSGVRCLQCDYYQFINAQFGRISVITFADRTKEDEIRQKLSLQLEETHRHAIAKDNFFANMSHEIRTPINAILGMTYFAKTMTHDEKCLKYIEKIENASDLLLGVVNDILDFSKMQEHKFSLNPEDFNLHDLKKILFDLFSFKSEQKNLRFQVNFDIPPVYFVHGDQFRLTQIFMNLVGNAIKFTEHGFVSVSLNHEELGSEVILRCTVRDSGCGLTEEDLSRLFTEFEQFGKVLEKKQEGTGLGLAITKRLVELMHGVIWVDSTVNKGSSFHFVVVLQKSEHIQLLVPDTSLPRIVLKTGRVLLVEDNDINAEIAESLLEESGCIVDRAGDGMEAVDLCRNNPVDYYDLVLMDIHMPRMNGYEAARILKKEVGITCPVIAVTATSEDASTLNNNRDIIMSYILKPYNPGVFHTIFRKPGGE